MLWLLLLFVAHVDFSGTWKVREPIAFVTAYEKCEFRGVVAHVSQIGDRLTGRYEAQVSCTDPHWPDQEWRTRVGTLDATIDGNSLTVSIDQDFVFQATVDGSSITGTLESLSGTPDQTWTANRLAR